MDIIPAVDIMNGKVVRLLKGKPEFATSYGHLGDPVSLAKKWEAEGTPVIHVIDLDAALGLGNNLDIIQKIVRSVQVPVQVGGGIRRLIAARRLLNSGVRRVILGSLAFKTPSVVEELLDEFGEGRIIIALDNLKGEVMVRGWKASSGVTVSEAVEKFTELGVKRFLVTSVARDGTLSGPDLETLTELCGREVEVIAAGGIGSLNDLAVLNDLGLSGVVVGKALYEGAFSLSEALRAVNEE